MRVVINQPNYIPWRGYFDLIDDADLFLIYDDVQYTDRDWRNRNQIKTKDGKLWLTVPVKKPSRATLIKDIDISYDEAWQEKHKKTLAGAYGRAPHYSDYAKGFFGILEKRFEKLVDLNVAITRFILDALEIRTPMRRVSELGVLGAKTEKLINIISAVGGDDYLSGPSAKNYIDLAIFVASGIGLAWKNYDYAPYPQLWGEFEDQVSVLDLLFNCGAKARNYLKSRRGDERTLVPHINARRLQGVAGQFGN